MPIVRFHAVALFVTLLAICYPGVLLPRSAKVLTRTIFKPALTKGVHPKPVANTSMMDIKYKHARDDTGQAKICGNVVWGAPACNVSCTAAIKLDRSTTAFLLSTHEVQVARSGRRGGC